MDCDGAPSPNPAVPLVRPAPPEPRSGGLQGEQVRAALKLVQDPAVGDEDKVQMLMEIAMGLQLRPQSPDALYDAVALYRHALELVPFEESLWRARLEARMATALHGIPDGDDLHLQEARAALDRALPSLHAGGLPAEAAEAEMNLGVVLHALHGFRRARLTDAIAAYHRALRVFERERYPTEFAILHNNLATAYLALPMTDERGKMREALAVQSFEAALAVVTLIDYPTEYAMLQNNLGNALQYASSAHMLENNVRALAAYDEALKVRTADAAPVAHANTLSNKANALRNVPDAAGIEAGIGDGRPGTNRATARGLYREAMAIFAAHGEPARARAVAEALADLDTEVDPGAPVEA